MDSNDDIRKVSKATAAFERELESLVLTSFGNGAAIEGEWRFELPVTDAPNWTVEIRKTYADDADASSRLLDR